MTILRAETTRIYVATDSKGRRFRRLRKHAAYRAAARRVLDECDCEGAGYDENGRCTYLGSTCRFHEDGGAHRHAVIERLARMYERADRRVT